MKMIFKITLFTFTFLSTTNLLSNTIDGIELKNIVNSWLEERNQPTNINMLDELKYPLCERSKMIISDISGNYNLIKIKCVDKNPWQLILRNKKIRESSGKTKKTLKTFALKRNLKNGTILTKEHLKEINKKVVGQSVYITNYSDILGKKLKRNMNKNISLQFNDLQNDWLIEKDTIVTIINNKANITIRESGIAMESANFMDRLIVKNIKSGKVIQVYAKNKKNVVFNPKQFKPNVVNN
jgi:flagella basal body P-ring formation protein FlgA